MSASQILLAGHGQEDQWLSNNPDRTYFEAKYRTKVNRSRETYEIPFDNQVTFDSTGRCTIQVKGDYMTRMTLRTVMPPIYPTVPGQYVFPTPSSEVGATVYVNKALELVVADGVTLTANTTGNHYFSIGAQVTLAGTAYVIFDLDGTYTITGIPTANSFTCSTTLSGISYNGVASTQGIQCGDIISYFSTANSNLWVNNVTNKTWQITGGSNVGTSWTFTTSAPSNFPVGSSIVLNLPKCDIVNKIVNVIASTDTTFTCTSSSIKGGTFVILTNNNQGYSVNDGNSWIQVTSPSNTPHYNVAYGNGIFVSVWAGSVYTLPRYSSDLGRSWKYATTYVFPSGNLTYGNGFFVTTVSTFVFSGVYYYYQSYSSDGNVWNQIASPLLGTWNSIIYGNGKFIMVGNNVQAYSSDNGLTWNYVSSPLSGTWNAVAFGNGTFVMVGNNVQAYSSDNGLTWTYVSSPTSGTWNAVTYGNGAFVMVGPNIQAYSTDNGLTWILTVNPLSGTWQNVAYGEGVFVMVGDDLQAYSNDNGITWNFSSNFIVGTYPSINGVAFADFSYVNSPSDSVSLVVPPLQLTDRVFSSIVYPSISFVNAADAAFWGFDSREGLTYALPATPPWTLTQSGWINGFLPPSTSTYDDSVANKLCKSIRILVGKQTIKEYSGEYIELQNDLLVSYENKAILKLINGTLDQTQATVAREYYVNLPLGMKEIPLCALTHQHMSVEIDFDSYQNLSQNLNPGTGSFVDSKSFVTYDASTGLLNGQPVNVQTTFSYQQYIFIVTYGGQFIIFDTTKNVNDPNSYIVLSAFSGSSLFEQFCVLSGNLYIGLSDGQLVRGLIDELIQGNISSLEINSYNPTIGSLTGTIVADFRYVYYTVSNTVTSNVFMTKYDTTGVFTNAASYTTVDFTKTFNSNVTGVYQTLSTGTQLIVLPRGTQGKLYTYQLNANVQSQWYLSDVSSYGNSITGAVDINDKLYFLIDGYLLGYSNSTYTPYSGYTGNNIFIGVGNNTQTYSFNNGVTWTSSISPLLGNWKALTLANSVVVFVGVDVQAYSKDKGTTWISVANPLPGTWNAVGYGNGTFVMVGDNKQAYSTDNGLTWSLVSSPLSGTWKSTTYGNGTFVMVGAYCLAYSTDNGKSWNLLPYNGSDFTGVTFGNGKFVMVGIGVESYSYDGIVWIFSYSYLRNLSSVTFGNGIFVAPDNAILGDGLYSYDGIVWNAYLGSASNGPCIAYGNGYFVTPSLYSSNGVVFYQSSKYILGINSIACVQFGDGIFNYISASGSSIYASMTNNVAVQIDTTQDLSTAAAYKFPAPVPASQYVFANGPRYVYMFAQGDNTATNIVEFDPYGPDTTFKASILVDYESLPPGVKKPDKALLGLIQTQKVTDMTQMNIKGPVKELWVTGTSSTSNVFQYSNLATRSTLEIAGEQIVTDDVGTHTFFNVIEPYEAHTSMPIRNVSVLPFEFDPESETPNGTVNFSRIRDQIFDGDAQTVWARTYNLLAIQGGIGNLMYN